MNKLSSWFYRISPGWAVILGIVMFLTFSALTLPGQSAAAEKYSGGEGSPDMSVFYSGSELYQMADNYGVEGRQAYLRARWTFDLAFPIVYSFFLLTSLSWLFNKGLAPDSKWRLLNLAPAGAFIFDILENTTASLAMARFPLHCPPAELLGPVFTPIKWLFVGGSFLLLLPAAILALSQSLKNRVSRG